IPDTTYGPVLTLIERHIRDDSYAARSFGLQMLHLCISGWPTTEEELWQVDRDYPMNEHARAMCRIGPAFVESVDDDVSTDKERCREDSDSLSVFTVF
ncbi:hypothetical protein HAX54_022739, partial [Datura stramonium]|nr:hypothetical protein [Datura stramonium]